MILLKVELNWKFPLKNEAKEMWALKPSYTPFKISQRCFHFTFSLNYYFKTHPFNGSPSLRAQTQGLSCFHPMDLVLISIYGLLILKGRLTDVWTHLLTQPPTSPTDTSQALQCNKFNTEHISFFPTSFPIPHFSLIFSNYTYGSN